MAAMKMSTFSLAVFALLAACVLVKAVEDPTEALEGVHDLTPDTFDKFVNGGKHALVEFYAPWCGHCKHLTPEYKKVGAAVTSDGKLKNRVVIAKVNADDHRSLGERFGVQGFPTIKWFARGKPVDEPETYSQARKAEDFLQFIHQKLDEDKGFARVDSLDEFAKQFKAGAIDLSSIVTQLTEAASSLTDEAQKSAGELYVKYGQKAAEKGVDYFKTEVNRLERLLSGGKVGGTKAAEISRKLSVLGSFLEGEEESES